MAKILLVDDERSIRRTLGEFLRQAGHDVVEAEDAEAALRRLQETDFDVVVSDIILPRVTGVELLRRIRDCAPDVKVVMMTGEPTVETASEALRAGATDYLFKPITKAAITRVVEQVTRIKALEDAKRRLEAENRTLQLRHLERVVERQTAALLSSEARYRALVETALDWVWEVDASWRYTYASPRVQGLLGFGPEEVLGHTPFALMPEDEARRVEPLFIDVASRREPFLVSVNTRHRDGRLVVLETSAIPILDEDGRLLGYRGMDRDITERRLVEEQLRQLARAVEQSPVSIMITDRDGNIEFVNPKFVQVTGYTFEEVRGKNPRILKSGETPEEEYQRLWAALSTGQEWRGEFHNKRKDGTQFLEAASVSALRDGNGAVTHFIAVKEDITEKKLTEAKFLRAQRVEGIGSLASGIAHDLNNILAPIILGAPMLEWDDSPENRRQVAKTIEASAQRAASIVHQLLTFARGKEGVREAVEARHLVRDMARIARETFPRTIQIEEACAPDLWPVVADPTQLHQVLLNLCVNARDAMPAGGVLTLGADNVVLDEHYVAMDKIVKPGPHVRIRVTDTGTGIPESVRPNIFESFFTTKAEGQGTGLGLTTAQGIVQDHGGVMTFSTAVGRGTTFEIHLPASCDATRPADAARTRAALPRGEGELVLVVDDEPAMCEAARRTLERYGYRVVVAQDGIQALVQFSAHQPDVRAVVTDWMMPLMDGVTLCRVLKALSPDLPVIVSSGGLFGSAGIEASRVLEQVGVRHILHKPHNIDILLVTLAQVLGHAATPAPEGTRS